MTHGSMAVCGGTLSSETEEIKVQGRDWNSHLEDKEEVQSVVGNPSMSLSGFLPVNMRPCSSRGWRGVAFSFHPQTTHGLKFPGSSYSLLPWCSHTSTVYKVPRSLGDWSGTMFMFIRHFFNSSCYKDNFETLHIFGLLFPCGVCHGLPRVTSKNRMAQLAGVPRSYSRSEPTGESVWVIPSHSICWWMNQA